MRKKHIMIFIAICGLVGASVGISVNTAGVFYSPIANDLGVGRGSVALITTIISMVGAFTALILPKILKESNLKLLMIISSLVLVGTTALQSIATSIWMLYVLAFFRGAAFGLTNFVFATLVLNNWFYAKRGLFTSIVMMFSGIPGVIFSPIFSSLISSIGWRTTYLVVAGLMLLFCLPIILFPISIKPETIGEKPYGYEEFIEAKNDGEIIQVDDAKATKINQSTFILVMLFSMLTCYVAGIPQHLPSFAETLGFSASLGAMMLSVSMVANIGSKMLFGVLSEKIGTLKTIITILVMSIIGCLGLLYIHTQSVLLGSTLLFCVTFSISSVAISLVTSDLFGLDNYGRIYPIVSFAAGIVNAFAATFTGTIYDMTGSYILNFYIALIMQIAIIVILVIAYRSKKIVKS